MKIETHLNDSFIRNRNPDSGKEIVLLVFLAALCYLPFINKAIHIDGDMLVHTAGQIAANPLNPALGEYGEHMVLHDHTKMPRWSVYYRTGHPPLLPMLMAPLAAMSPAGKHEWLFHLMLFPFFILSIFSVRSLLGLFYKAEFRFWGTLLWAASPGLLINAHNIMWDVVITACMISALVAFLYALRTDSARLFLVSGIITGLAALTKVNALPLYVLLGGYLVVRNKWKFLAWWAVPAIVLPLVWVFHNLIVYEKIQYVSIGWLSMKPGDVRYRIERNFAYFGAALLTPFCWFWLIALAKRYREAALFGVFGLGWGALLVAVLKKSVMHGVWYALFAASGSWLLYRMATLCISGISETTGRYTVEARLLSAYTVLYCGVLIMMPSANLRYILPLVPLGLLVVGRELEKVKPVFRKLFLRITFVSGLVFSILFAVADYLACEADRQLPGRLVQRGYVPAKTWYFGRLSFDYYLYQAGFRHLRVNDSKPAEGDFLINQLTPADYDAKRYLSKDLVAVPQDTIGLFGWPFRTLGLGAGFYGSERLPFSFAPGRFQKSYCMYRLEKRL